MSDRKTAAVQVDVTEIVKERIAADVAAALSEPGVVEHFVHAVLEKEVERGYGNKRGKTMLQKAVEDMVQIAAKKVIQVKLKEMEGVFVAALEQRMGQNVPAMARGLADGFLAGLENSERRSFKVQFTAQTEY